MYLRIWHRLFSNENEGGEMGQLLGVFVYHKSMTLGVTFLLPKDYTCSKNIIKSFWLSFDNDDIETSSFSGKQSRPSLQ